MSGERLRGVLFDLDGVLIDSGRDIMHAVNWTLEKNGLPALPYETVKTHIGHGAAELLARCFGEYGPEHREAAEKALPAYKTRYLAHSVVETSLYPGVEEGLSQLAGLPMAVVTNKPGALADQILKHFGIRRYFGCLVSPEMLTRMKPDPEGLQLAMKEFGLAPGETVMVGDTWSDVEAGRQAGTRTIGVTWGLGEPTSLRASSPDWLAHTFPGLVRIIQDASRTKK